MGDFFLPELFANLLMDPLIPVYRQLTVFSRHIHQHAIMMCRMVHLEVLKNFCGTVQRMYIATLAFYKHPDLTACLLLSQFDSFYYLIFFSRGEKILLLYEWDTQAEKLNDMIRILHPEPYPSPVQIGNSLSYGTQTFQRK